MKVSPAETVVEYNYEYDTAKHTSILIPGNCTANSKDDQIDSILIVGEDANELSAVVGFKVPHTGWYTRTYGVLVECWHHTKESLEAIGTWDSTPVFSETKAADLTGGYDEHTHSFSFTPQRLTQKYHFIRCGIIDKNDADCQFDTGSHCATASAGDHGSSAHHFDNADVNFTVTPVTASACTVTAYEHWSPNMTEDLAKALVGDDAAALWDGDFKTGDNEVFYGTNKWPLHKTANKMSSLKITGSDCRVRAYADPACTDVSNWSKEIKWNTNGASILGSSVTSSDFLGIVVHENSWNTQEIEFGNDWAQCLEVCRGACPS